jgi:hypothetical protein
MRFRASDVELELLQERRKAQLIHNSTTVLFDFDPPHPHIHVDSEVVLFLLSDFELLFRHLLSPLLRSSAEHPSHRRAYRLVLSMNAANPATGAAYPFFELRAYPLDMLLPGLQFLDRNNPADPLVAGERCDILPFR